MLQDILMYLMLLVVHLISASLAFAVFSSIFIQNKKKGYIFLAVMSLAGVYQLSYGFSISMFLGIGLIFMYISLGVISYIVIKKKQANDGVL